MKQKILFLSIILMTAVFPAAAKDYATLLKEAKSYEASGNYVYALGTYYDAMESNRTAAAADALDGFERVGKLVAGGQLANGKASAEYRAWEKLCREFEKYFTENIPVRFDLSKPECTDMATSTYTVSVQPEPSYKYTRIYGYVKTGFKKSWSSAWASTLDKLWPYYSSYKSEFAALNTAPSSAVLKDGIALYKFYGYNQNLYTASLY